MKNTLKRFVEWVTLSNQNEFKKAVVFITAYYTVGVFIVLVLFNFLVYGLFTNSIRTSEDDIYEQSSLEVEDTHELNEIYIEEIEENLISILLTSDAFILVLTVIVAFMLAKKTLAPIEEAYRKQSRFIADAAHELRTPLTVMKAGSEVILSNERTGDEYRKFIEELLEEVERLTALSNDLLFLASSKKKRTVTVSEVAFSEVCEKQVHFMRAYANSQHVSITADIVPDVTILGNKDDLVRLVVNLLKNAVDYNKPEGNVLLKLIKNNHNILLTISDNGIGIKKEDISHIFERFYKADSSRTSTTSGAGLGLAIVKEITNNHKGYLKVESILGQGTTFQVILPSL